MPELTHAGGIVFRQTPQGPEYLVVEAKKNPTHKLFPKGHIEPGETTKETALREVREEAGVAGELISPLDTVELTVGNKTFQVEYFLIKFTKNVEKDEQRGMGWFVYEKAMEILTFRETRELLRRAHALVTEADS